jgi:hypothetical protein
MAKPSPLSAVSGNAVQCVCLFVFLNIWEKGTLLEGKQIETNKQKKTICFKSQLARLKNWLKIRMKIWGNEEYLS